MARSITVAPLVEHRIEPRQVAFMWSSAPLHWLRGDAFASHMINEFSYLLTEGEIFFCRVFAEALPLVSDERLRVDVKAFIGQEAVHSRAHRDSIDAYLKRVGIDGGRFDRQNRTLFHRVLAARPGGRSLPRRLQRPWLLVRVGIVAAVEHFTAGLGTFTLESEWEGSCADPEVADLFRWHGAEEIEHRTVAYELYRHLGGGYALRALLLLIVAPALVRRIIVGTAHMMRQDPSVPNANARLWGPKFWSEWRRSVGLRNAPSLRWFARHAVRFLRPGYAPIEEASTEQALRYIRSSPGVLRALGRDAECAAEVR